jgi:integrase
MSVRKREWLTAKGEAKTAWLVDYRDQAGARRFKTFSTRKPRWTSPPPRGSR